MCRRVAVLRRRLASLAAVLLLLVGCGEASQLAIEVRDADVRVDEPAVADARSFEPAQPLDAGVWLDVGFADAVAAARDATPELDGGADALDIGTLASDAGSASGIGARCFSDIFDPAARGPNYDQFTPEVGSHCKGTNHQDIVGVERVVFLGDSVTVGTPPTNHDDYYRTKLADALAARFGLEPASSAWKRSSVLDGQAMRRESGAFASCAKWGARTDDLLRDNSQIGDCFPEAERTKRTLVIMTIGGNDIASITKMGPAGVPLPEIRAKTEAFVELLSAAVAWLKDPANFPNGSYVVFGNMFEFTDGTGDVGSCPAASVAGFDEAWSNPRDLEDLVIWANEQYMRIAVDTGSDLVWMLEHFCGHGYHHDDPSNRCYRGPAAERWFDVSCIHPNPTGHGVLAEMFMSVVEE
ncbi:MAG: SGNH/GDSL hydrolase family protein [Deltaproteobacteria bacterium]|nr:SGNH/GDSL hydrolase family protein [Deltaproteobacteria bacterium]